ncbi:MAG: amidohydrolase family protein [Firmicutes bacterium]|nr:amidohydrolase family protein [Bacillota bacterium]
MLLKNCRLPDGRQVDIRLEGENIVEIASGLSGDEADTLDVKGKLVSPGFVDCHLHLDKTLIALDTPNESGTLDEAIKITRSRKSEFTKNEVKERARKTIERAIANGTTWLRSNIDIDPIVGLTGLEALLELREEYRDKVDMQLVAFPQEGINKSPGTLELMIEALKSGADVVGGIPAKDIEPELHITKVFDLAERFAVPLDIHTDESDNPADLTLVEIARQTMARGLEGKVAVAHCCSLAALPPNALEAILTEIAPAQLNVVSLPSTNLYLQGRGDSHRVRRGIAPVRALLDKGFTVAFASDNIRDAFNPFGTANLLQIGLMAAHGCHMGGVGDLNQVFTMLTTAPARIVGANTGLRPGAKADLVILDAESPVQAIIEQAPVLERIYRGVADGRWCY